MGRKVEDLRKLLKVGRGCKKNLMKGIYKNNITSCIYHYAFTTKGGSFTKKFLILTDSDPLLILNEHGSSVKAARQMQ